MVIPIFSSATQCNEWHGGLNDHSDFNSIYSYEMESKHFTIDI